MRNHRLATLVAAAAMATASGLVVASPAHAATATFVLQNENSGGAVNGTPVQQWTCDSISNENWSSGPPVTTRQSFLGDPGPLVTGEELISGVSGTSSHCVSAGLFYGVPLSLMSCTSQSWELFN
jgi:hypothetical protein